MLRFCGEKQTESDSLEIVILEEKVLINDNLWRNTKVYFRRAKREKSITLSLLPIADEEGNIVCYGWQDDEANRELRMLNELEKNTDALQFKDIFPEIQEVLICGCNELAYRFAKYLENQQVKVSVTGKYWNYFGYKSIGEIDIDDVEKMVIYAEPVLEKTGNLFQRLIRSASSAFECIDLIYEANVKVDKIKNTEGKFEWLVEKLAGKNVYLIGISNEAQDTYDLLYEHGVDISGFIYGEDTVIGASVFLGKNKVSSNLLMEHDENAAVINCTDKDSALGTESQEYYYYYGGYKRNEQYFMIHDYIDIPCNNLIHILKGKTVFLAGEEILCKILAEYLKDIEKGHVDVRYGELSECRKMKATDIFCAVYPYDNPRFMCKKVENFWKEVDGIGEIQFTPYFSDSKVFVEMDRYMKKGSSKYSLKQLKPKGILLGSVPGLAGCQFIRGIMDGHPDIITGPNNAFINNLFLYCIRLAGDNTDNILPILKDILTEEYEPYWINVYFSDWNIFKSSAEKWLFQKERVTSQELFMIIFASYAEMMTGEKITDLSKKVIYWEPHGYLKDKYCFLEKWLEDEAINGQTMIVRRDNMTFSGSWHRNYLRLGKVYPGLNTIFSISQEYWINASHETVSCKHWQIFRMRFEDIKLHPKEKLLNICDRMGISWSETMMHTTSCGEAAVIFGSQDFTLKPVFDKSEKYFSAFDQFRIAVISAPYQKKYGYSYVDCTNFSRSKLWEMFLEEFRFQHGMQFETTRDRAIHYIKAYDALRRQLWETRKHAVLDDIIPEFGPVEIEKAITGSKENSAIVETEAVMPKERKESLIELVKQQEKLVLYGIGRDCGGLLQHLDEAEKDRLLYCDRKASQDMCVYQGKRVLAPQELCEDFKDYMILITSSMFVTSIRWELEDMGINPERIICNYDRLWLG